MKKESSNEKTGEGKKKKVKSDKTDPGAGIKSSKSKKEDFPGYPHYPADEDILNPGTGNRKAEVDVEDLSRLGKNDKAPRKPSPPANSPLSEQPSPMDLTDSDSEESPSESDVTPEEIQLLGSDELNADLGEDVDLKKRVYPVDMTAEDLDVPGADLDDETEEIGEEDEENNYYSLGGDNHEDLEEDRS